MTRCYNLTGLIRMGVLIIVQYMHKFADGSTVERLTTHRDSIGTPSWVWPTGGVVDQEWGWRDAAGNQLLGTIMTLRLTRLG